MSYELPTSTREALDWLIVYGTASRLKRFAANRPEVMLEAMRGYVAQRRKDLRAEGRALLSEAAE